jgi:hypothetical protein
MYVPAIRIFFQHRFCGDLAPGYTPYRVLLICSFTRLFTKQNTTKIRNPLPIPRKEDASQYQNHHQNIVNTELNNASAIHIPSPRLCPLFRRERAALSDCELDPRALPAFSPGLQPESVPTRCPSSAPVHPEASASSPCARPSSQPHPARPA